MKVRLFFVIIPSVKLIYNSSFLKLAPLVSLGKLINSKFESVEVSEIQKIVYGSQTLSLIQI